MHQASMQQQQMKRPSEWDDTRAAKKTGTIRDVIPHEDVLRASIEGKFSGPTMDKLWDDIGDREIVKFAGKLARAGKRAIDLRFLKFANEICSEAGTTEPFSGVFKIVEVYMQELKACINDGIKQHTAIIPYTAEAMRDALEPHRCVVRDEFIKGLAALATDQDWSEESVFDIENFYKEGSEEIDKVKVTEWLFYTIDEIQDPQRLN